MDFKKILVPTDFSAAARVAIASARTIAERFGAEVELIHVYEVPPLLPMDQGAWMVPGARGEPIAPHLLLKSLAAKEMERLVGDLRASGMMVHSRIEEGNVWRAINRVVEHEHHDLIVIATHGRTGLERLVMGSTAEQVVRHATCPVLVVRPERAATGAR